MSNVLRNLLNSMFVILALIVSLSGFVLVNTSTVEAAMPEKCKKSILGFPVWFEYLDADENCTITGPPGDKAGEIDWAKASGYVAIAIVEIMMRLASLVAVGYVVFGGFKLITSQGEPESAKDARNTIINALIGLVITMIAATLINFITTRLTS